MLVLANKLSLLLRLTHSLMYDYFVGKSSAIGQLTRPTQPSIPLGWVNK